MYTRIAKIALLSSTCLLFSCFLGSSEVVRVAKPADNETPLRALSKAAELFEKRGDLNKAREAIDILGKARNIEDRNYEVEWKFARYSYYLGSRRSLGDNEIEKVLKQGLEAARIAKRMEPKKPDGYFWYGAILGEQSRRSPVTVGIVSVGKIKSAMNKVIEIDPDYQGASAYDALGQVELASRGLAGGSAEKALEHLRKGLELNENNAYVRLHLGEAYLALNKDAEAKKHLEYIKTMKPSPDFIPEYEEALEQAKVLLKTKF